jgi:hypothetical protein
MKRKNPPNSKFLPLKGDHGLGMSLNFCWTGRVSMNVIQSVYYSQYVNFCGVL